jgi:hypothetical protein
MSESSLKVEPVEERVFESFDTAYASINSRDYQSITVPAGQCVLEKECLSTGNMKLPMWNVFVDAIYALTKLPRRNEVVLPTDNLLRDVNTLFSQMGDEELLIRVMNGKAYTAFKAGAKGTRQPLTHAEFLTLLQQNIDTEEVRRVDLSKKMCRVVTYSNETVEPIPSDFHHVGYDYINGDTLKSCPLSAALLLYRTACENSAIAPFNDKIYKFKASENLDLLRQRYAKVLADSQIDYDLIARRLNRVAKLPVNIEILRFLLSGTNGIPMDVKKKIFEPYYLTDENGNLTKIPIEDALSNVSVFEVYNRITEAAHRSGLEIDARYKLESFAGSLLDEHNKKFGALTWKYYKKDEEAGDESSDVEPVVE